VIEVITRVICDGPVCQDLDGHHAEAPGCWGPAVNRVGARALAAKVGWTIGQGRDGKDLCPTCTKALAANRPAIVEVVGDRFEFEEAGRLRDEIRRLEADELGLPDGEKKAPLVGRSNEGRPGTRKMRYGKTQKKWKG